MGKLTFFDYEIPVLKALAELGDSAEVQKVFPLVEEIMSLKNKHTEEYGYYKKQSEIIWKNKTSWAREYLKRKGQLDASIRGIWKITDAGKERLRIFNVTGRDPDEGKARLEGVQAEIINTTEKPEKVFERIDKIHDTGDILNIKGIVYEPINEQGVILLFAAICGDIEFRIEGIRVGFPDALLRRKNQKGNWSSCRAEFEFKSSDYKLHKHPIKGCDLIICWEDNWKECPLEVLELKKEIKRFKKD